MNGEPCGPAPGGGGQTATGWLFDLYPQKGDMVFWFILENGRRLRLTRPYAPAFYVEAPSAGWGASRRDEFRRLIGAMAGLQWVGLVERLDFWSGRPRTVLEIRFADMDLHKTSLQRVFRLFPELTYYDCDIAPEVHYCYATGVFPTARCRVRHEAGRLIACEALESPADADYTLLPLRVAELSAEFSSAGGAADGPMLSLRFEFEGREIAWDTEDPAEALESLNDAIRRADPDLILTRGGDSILMPRLFALAGRLKMELALDREPGVRRRVVLDGHTFMSYGRVLYHAPDYPLWGRWHVDRDNSFWSEETGLAGLIEVARMAKLPAQRAARRSIGTGISSIQLELALREGYLIPWKKSHPEAWKSAATLLKSDRGGLVYQPLTGVYEDVLELDFVSMYPSIMVRRNVSPETVNCPCCGPEADGSNVAPEIEYHLCRRREGLVSRAIAPLIEKRKTYKRMMREMAEAAKSDPEIAARRGELDGRQGALKWLLVCCFGYLGYRNARFGRIEAHEATTAYSRELLLRTKEKCEERGWDVIHAIVDCVWIRKPGAAAEEIEELRREIETATGLDIALEGRYRWIAFLPSRRSEDTPVPNRYFGCFQDGKLKFRGIETRRSDQPPYIRDVQKTLLEALARAEGLAAIRAMAPELIGVAREAETAIFQREVPIESLILSRKTSRDAEEYRSNCATALAVRQAARGGIRLHAGETVHYVTLNAKDRDPDSRIRLVQLLRAEDHYDPAFYVDLLRRAAATILEPFLGKNWDQSLGMIYAKTGPRGAPGRRRPSRRATSRDDGRYSQPDLFG